MSLDILEGLDRDGAFAPNRRFQDLPRYHVPFDELVEATATEAVVRRAIENREGAAVVGGAGTGKSSVIASVLDPLVGHDERGLTPVRLMLGADDDVATDPRRFVQQLIATIVDAAPVREEELEEFRVAASDREQRQGKATTWHGALGAPKWLINAEASRDVQSFAQSLDRERSAAELIESAKELFATLRERQLEPILIFDDTDTWLNVQGHEKLEVADLFFAEVFRPVLRELACPVVAAVHPAYADVDGYMAARDLLVNESVVPTMDNRERAVGAITRVIGHIIEVHDVGAPVDGLFDGGATVALGEYYMERQAIRDVLLVVQRAVKETISNRADSIGDGAIGEAIRYWADARH